MRFLTAIAVSVAVHLLIGFGIWLGSDGASAPDVRATLELSSVELSLAEERDDMAAANPTASVSEPSSPRPETPVRPEAEIPPVPLPEIPAAADILRPVERPVLPPVREPEVVASPAPVQARIEAPPRPRRPIRPEYPRGARQRGEQGDVVVELRVGANGSVDAAEVVVTSGFADLDAAALRAVRAARFSPAESGGETVASTARMTLSFRLK